MKKSTATGLILIVLLGLMCGPVMLESAHAAQPPFDWPSVFLCFFGILLGLPFVIGIQLFRSDPKFAQMAVACFGPIAVLLLASGLSAFIVGLFREGLTPQSVFSLLVGSLCSLQSASVEVSRPPGYLGRCSNRHFSPLKIHGTTYWTVIPLTSVHDLVKLGTSYLWWNLRIAKYGGA